MFRVINKILLALIILSLGYLFYNFLSFRSSDFGVFSVEQEYTQGPENADLMVMDFSRYGCPHCITLHPILMEAIAKDGRITYAPRFPTFSLQWSQTLAASVYAAEKQGKFFEMHEALYQYAPVDKHEKLYDVAKRIGLNVETLKEDMNDPQLRTRMEIDNDYFVVLRLQRTPTLLIGPELVYTFDGENTPSVDDLIEMFNEARAAQKK